MTEIYDKKDLERVLAQKKRSLTYFFIVTGVYALLTIALFIWFLFEPYGSKREPWMLVGESVLTGIYVVFAYVYISIRVIRVNRYAKALRLLLTKKPGKNVSNFMRFNSDIITKSGVDYKSMTVIEWSEKEKEYMEHNVLLDVEKPRPSFFAGDEIEYYTYSNVLVSYNLLNRSDFTGTPFEKQLN